MQMLLGVGSLDQQLGESEENRINWAKEAVQCCHKKGLSKFHGSWDNFASCTTKRRGGLGLTLLRGCGWFLGRDKILGVVALFCWEQYWRGTQMRDVSRSWSAQQLEEQPWWGTWLAYHSIHYTEKNKIRNILPCCMAQFQKLERDLENSHKH